jgi:DNA modification methylase
MDKDVFGMVGAYSWRSFFDDVVSNWRILQGDALDVLRTLDDESVNCCVTSPPYWGLRDYGIDGQLGLERTPKEYVEKLVEVFREVRRVLRGDGTVWLNLGDCYYSGDRGGYRNDSHRWENCPMQSKAKGSHMEVISPNRLPQEGLKDKDLCGIPWRVAFALQADGWYLRSDIIWSKPNPMPESVTDRPTKAHEYIFLLAKSARYYYDQDAIREDYARLWDKTNGGTWAHVERFPEGSKGGHHSGEYPMPIHGGPNKRSVWQIATRSYPAAHFATFPPKLIEPCILAGCPIDGTVLDPFAGAGTTGLVSLRLNRKFLGIELSEAYVRMATDRILEDAPLLNSRRDEDSCGMNNKQPSGLRSHLQHEDPQTSLLEYDDGQ